MENLNSKSFASTDINFTETSLTLSLLQARDVVMFYFRPILRKYKITEQQWRVIRILHKFGQLEINKLANLTCILNPSMTGILKRMESLKLIERIQITEDKRRFNIKLTKIGDELFNQMIFEIEENYQLLRQDFGYEKLEQLLNNLEKIKEISPKFGK